MKKLKNTSYIKIRLLNITHSGSEHWLKRLFILFRKTYLKDDLSLTIQQLTTVENLDYFLQMQIALPGISPTLEKSKHLNARNKSFLKKWKYCNKI